MMVIPLHPPPFPLISYLDDSSSVNLEFVLEGNPRAPRILLEQKLTAPITAYVQKAKTQQFHLSIFPSLQNKFRIIFFTQFCSQSEWLGIQWVWMKFAWWKVFAVISTSLFSANFSFSCSFCALSGNVASSRIFSAGWLSRGENKPNFFVFVASLYLE